MSSRLWKSALQRSIPQNILSQIKTDDFIGWKILDRSMIENPKIGLVIKLFKK